MLDYLPARNSTDIITWEFNYAILKVDKNKVLDIFTDHDQVVNNATHISRYFYRSCIHKENFGGRVLH